MNNSNNQLTQRQVAVAVFYGNIMTALVPACIWYLILFVQTNR